MSITVKKQDLADFVAKDAGLSKKHAEAVVEAIFEKISSSLAAGDSVQIFQFGQFKVSERKARNGVNPATGAKIKISASKAVTFKASSSLKDVVNKKKKKK